MFPKLPFFCQELSLTWWRHQINGNTFRVTGPLCGEFTGHRCIPLTKASNAELWCFLWSAPWINGWVNNREAGDLRHHRAHYDVIGTVTALDFYSSRTCQVFNYILTQMVCKTHLSHFMLYTYISFIYAFVYIILFTWAHSFTNISMCILSLVEWFYYVDVIVLKFSYPYAHPYTLLIPQTPVGGSCCLPLGAPQSMWETWCKMQWQSRFICWLNIPA